VEDSFFPEYKECDGLFEQNDFFKQEKGAEQLLFPHLLRCSSPEVTSLESSICPKQLNSFADLSDLAQGPGPELAQFEISAGTARSCERGDGALERPLGCGKARVKDQSMSASESKVFSC